MWVEGEAGITRVIYPPQKKKERWIIGIQDDQTKQGGAAEPPARFYPSGLELTLNNATIYRKDFKERDGDESLSSRRETFSLPLLPYMT